MCEMSSDQLDPSVNESVSGSTKEVRSNRSGSLISETYQSIRRRNVYENCVAAID